jgi:ACT domain-containing protein
MLIEQISIFVENKKGRLAEITKILADKNVDIRALSIADTTDYGILRLIVNNPKAAEKALADSGMTFTLTEVIAIGIPDVPGGLAGAVKVLSDKDITIEYIYAFLDPRQDTAFVILRVEDNEKAMAVLKENNIKLLTQSEVYTI